MKKVQSKTIWQGAVWLCLFAAVAVLVFRAVLPEGALLNPVSLYFMYSGAQSLGTYMFSIVITYLWLTFIL